MNPRAVLVGPPGSGKTTVGSLLARRLEVAYRDTDDDIELAAGKTISEIFTSAGEPAFRALEEKAISVALGEHRGILALGGGAILSQATRTLLRGHTVVFLNVGTAEGVRRTGMSTARPLLAGVNPRATYRALLEERLPIYRELATVEVCTDERDPAGIVSDIERDLPSWEAAQS